jgi:hypothetical protein
LKFSCWNFSFCLKIAPFGLPPKPQPGDLKAGGGFAAPFQGSIHFTWRTQGDALGWHGTAPLGRKKGPPPKPQPGDLITAQGKALGLLSVQLPKSQRGDLKAGGGFGAPFQGSIHFTWLTQGDALG